MLPFISSWSLCGVDHCGTRREAGEQFRVRGCQPHMMGINLKGSQEVDLGLLPEDRWVTDGVETVY